VQIKGIKEGLLVTFGEGNWQDLRDCLIQHVVEKQHFFKGARVAVDVGHLVLHASELGNLRDRLSDHGVTLWAVLSNSPTTEQTAQMLGLATRLSSLRQDRVIRPSSGGVMPGEPAIVIQKTIRSGYKIEHKSHIIIIGDVNPGAEVISSGSVIVWGKLKGLVHAGVEGDEKAIVCALELEPMQLRIANCIALTPQGKTKLEPEMVQIHNGQIVATPWKTKGKL